MGMLGGGSGGPMGPTSAPAGVPRTGGFQFGGAQGPYFGFFQPQGGFASWPPQAPAPIMTPGVKPPAPKQPGKGATPREVRQYKAAQAAWEKAPTPPATENVDATKFQTAEWNRTGFGSTMLGTLAPQSNPPGALPPPLAGPR